MSQTNGTAPKPDPPVLTSVQVRRSLQEQFKTALVAGKHQEARHIAESLLLFDDFGGSDLMDVVRPSSNDGPGWTTLSPPSVPTDRRHGERWPVWRTQQELDLYRQEARLRLAANSYAQGLLKNLINNVIGKGFSYTATPVETAADKLKKKYDRKEEDEADQGPNENGDGPPKPPRPPGSAGGGDEEEPDPGETLAAKVQEVIDEFCRLNNWNGGTHPNMGGVVVATREREIFRRVKGEDGECFLRFHFQRDGTTLVRFIEPERVRDLNGLWQEGWSFGIQHQMDPYEDVETILAYRVFWPDPSATGGEGDNNGYPEDIPADEVLHLRGPDTPATVKRGLSPFIFDVGKALDRAARGQRNASLGAAYRAATGEIWQHHTGTQQQVTELAASLGESVENPLALGGTETVERIRAPMIRRIPESQELVPLPPDQSESYQAAFQGDLRQAASAFAAPEFWLAETSSGNYSNLESAAAPAVRDGQTEQEYYKQAFCAAVWKAIKWACECGKLPADTEEKVKIEVEAPAVLHRNELEDAQQKQIENQAGVLSKQQWCAEKGRDYEQTAAEIQEDQDRFGPPMGQLPLPGDEDQPGFGGEHPPGQGPKRSPKAPKGTPAQESRTGATITHYHGFGPSPGVDLIETKDAIGHEHDARGRFGSGGGASSGGGEGREQRRARMADILTKSDARQKAHAEQVKSQHSTQRPDTPEYQDPHRIKVENDLAKVFETGIGQKPEVTYSKDGWTYFWQGNSPELYVYPKNGKIHVSDGDKAIPIAPDAPPGTVAKAAGRIMRDSLNWMHRKVKKLHGPKPAE